VVNEERAGADALPDPGDEVRVAWGLDVVRGHVVEAYRGVRRQVVVEIDPGQVSEESATVTVPLGAVEPTQDSHSRWAAVARYETAVAEALKRILPDQVSNIELNSHIADQEIDILARLSAGRFVIVDVKYGMRKLNRRVVEESLDRIHRVALKVGGVALLVLNQSVSDLPSHHVPPMAEIVTWRSPGDDGQLAAATEGLLAIQR
jgi:hypothetical protein